MYATLDDIRAEGITVEEANNGRVIAALHDAMETIDRACGWFFEPRELGFALSGSGNPVLELPLPPIRIMRIRIGTHEHSPEEFAHVGAPVGPQFYVPKLIRHGGLFPRGVDNIWVYGRWGYTLQAEGEPEGVTPREIRRATLLLALQYLPQLGSDESVNTRNHWRIVEERTRDQSYRMEAREEGALTGQPEVDAILLSYRRPMALGAA